MRLKTVYSVTILAAMLVLAACNAVDTTVNTNRAVNTNTAHPPIAANGPAITPTDGARRITTVELDALMKEGKAYVVDVRTQDVYDVAHIPGSHLIPANEVFKHADKLPRDKMIVTYCS